MRQLREETMLQVRRESNFPRQILKCALEPREGAYLAEWGADIVTYIRHLYFMLLRTCIVERKENKFLLVKPFKIHLWNMIHSLLLKEKKMIAIRILSEASKTVLLKKYFTKWLFQNLTNIEKIDFETKHFFRKSIFFFM